MHELSLMEDLVSVIASEVTDGKISVVRLEVGRHAGVLPRSLAFCFDVCAYGTALEGARLEIVETPGQELRLKEVEIE